MTTQSLDSLKIGEEFFSIHQYPLDDFIEKNKIERETFHTASWRGYEVQWEVIDNKLFLTKIDSATDALNELVKDDDILFASWYSGIIKVDLNLEYHHVYHKKENDFYLLISFDSGKVIDIRIGKNIKDKIVKVGKYAGFPFEEIVKGKIELSKDHHLKKYLEKILEYFFNQNESNAILIPFEHKFSETGRKLIIEQRNSELSYHITDDLLTIFYQNRENLDAIQCAKDYSFIIEKLFQDDFTDFSSIPKPRYSMADVYPECLLLNSRSEYLKWAFRYSKEFYVPPNEISKHYKVLTLKSFETTRLSDFSFEFTPVLEEIVFDFQWYETDKNIEKFESATGLIYDTKYRAYLMKESDLGPYSGLDAYYELFNNLDEAKQNELVND